MNDFVQNETFSLFYLLNWNLNKILYFSGIFRGQQMADHIWKLHDQGYFVIIVT